MFARRPTRRPAPIASDDTRSRVGRPRSATLLPAVGLASIVAFLSFSDRAPVLVRRALRHAARIASALEDSVGLDLVDSRALPYDWDVFGHVVLWFGVAVASRWAFRGELSALALAMWLAIASYATELGQLHLSTSRTPDPRDLVANAFGSVAGLTIAVIAMPPRRTSGRASQERGDGVG